MKEYNPNNKTKYVYKTEQLINPETGEITPTTTVYKQIYGSEQFYKVYLYDLLNALGMFSTSKQLDVLIYVFENINPSNNMFIGTYEKIMEDMNVSYDTTMKAIKKMIEANIIKRVQQGVYVVNPHYLLKGNENKKAKLILQYEEISKKNPSDSDENPKENPNI